MEGCGLTFSSCYNCITSGNYLVKLASNMSYCCAANPATLSEPVMLTYSKLSDCPPDMMSTYILAGTIGSVGLLACIIILIGFCMPNLLMRRESSGRRMPVSRIRYQGETEALLATVSDLPFGQPNYGFAQDTEQDVSHEGAASALGSIPPHIEMSPLPEPQVVPKPPQLPVPQNSVVYRETVARSMNTFRAKRPTTLAIRNPVYENIENFSFL